MIEDLGIASPTDVGYYSGMVDSAFSLAELLTVRIYPLFSAVKLGLLTYAFLLLASLRSAIKDFFLVITFGPHRPQAGDYDRSLGGCAQLCLLWLQ